MNVKMTKARARYLLANTKLGGDLRFAFAKPSDFQPTLYEDGITPEEDAEIKALWETMHGSSTYAGALTRISKVAGSDGPYIRAVVPCAAVTGVPPTKVVVTNVYHSDLHEISISEWDHPVVVECPSSYDEKALTADDIRSDGLIMVVEQ